MSEVKVANYKVCVVTGTRAEYGLLRPLMEKINSHERMELKLVVTGTHLALKFGHTVDEIIEDGFTDYCEIDILEDEDSKYKMAVSTGNATREFATYFENNRPDIVVILGDRFEMLSVATAAHLMGIPIAHISGGDVTEGAVDDGIRHCITKLSSLHFPGCEQSAKRIIQMGEQPETVFNVGEPGVENCLNTKLLTREELAENLKFADILGDYSIVTFHPVTMENDTAGEQLNELIKAMDEVRGMSYIITLANADAGGRTVNDIWEEEAKKHSNWYVISSLGVVRYLSAVKNAKAVIGNSSSGIIEAPAMHVPTVNIGDRQKGRMMAESVICCEPVKEQIATAIKKACSNEHLSGMKNMVSPFGDGRTSGLICEELFRFLSCDRTENKKVFYDMY